MVKSYLKYEHSKTFGLISSPTSNILWTPSPSNTSTSAGVALVAASEEVLAWDVKKGELLSQWRDENCKAQVTALAQSEADPAIYAAGYDDGSIRLWDSKIATVIVSYNGHKSAISHLTFDRAGVRLASGSKDTEIVVWDLVAEVGLYKLRGHKDQVTGLRFVEPQPQQPVYESGEAVAVVNGDEQREGFLLSTGKDSLIKLWDLSSRHCIETHVAQTNGECWALGIATDLTCCITAGNDGELKVWSLDVASLAAAASQVELPQATRFLTERGTLHCHGKDKATEIIFHPKKDYFAVHGVEKAVEIWRMRNEAEVKRSLARKRKRRREKLANGSKKPAGGDIEMLDGNETEKEAEAAMADADITDFFASHVVVRTSGKAQSAAWAATTHKQLQLLVATTNNQIEFYDVQTKQKSHKSAEREVPDYTKSLSVELPGHRTDVRALALSSDDKMLASASNGSLKIWNVRTRACIRTFECGYALCCSFLAGDQIVVVGTKSGELELFDVISASLLDSIAAHDGAIWSMQVHPSDQSIVTGSADKTVKFWDISVVKEQVLGSTRTTSRLKLLSSKTLKLSDDVLCVRFTPDARYVAAALLDNTVKIFFTDSLKLYLNLYGHKLPVLSMDISYDSKLIVTSSADKQVRIWGLDFGDCHKALFAHQDSILQVAFVPHNSDDNGHNFFSASKDRVIKYWDADKFEQIQRISGHHGEIWALAIGHHENILVSASHDKSIQIWRETDEQIFLEEEREREIEDLYEGTMAANLNEPDGDNQDEVAAAGKQTVETLMAGERIVEALELGLADLAVIKEWEEAKVANSNIGPPQRNPVFLALGNLTAEAYVMSVLQKIKAAALHDALLVLPFATVPSLFTFINIFAIKAMNTPLTCRILFFILKTHHSQIVATRTMRAMLTDIRGNLRDALKRQKDEMGYNVAALRVMGMQIKERGVKDYVDENWEKEEAEKGNVKKRAFVQVS